MTVLREPPWYQEIFKEGLVKGEQKGIQQSLQQGEANLVLRQLSRRFGAVDSVIAHQIRQLDIPQLESLGESLLDFQSISVLHDWLQQLSSIK